jgi:hypothetical protein
MTVVLRALCSADRAVNLVGAHHRTRLVPTVTLEAVIAWLDSGQPDPDRAAEHIWRAIEAVIQAAHTG